MDFSSLFKKKELKLNDIESISVGKGKYNVNVIYNRTPDGAIFIIVGGDKPHIGAVAVGEPRESLRYKGTTSCNVSIFSRLGHKDDLVAKKFAEKVAKSLGEYVVVIAGIHIDNATDEDIRKILENVKRAMEITIDKLKRN